MKKHFMKLSLVALAFATILATSCGKDDDVDNNDEHAAVVAEQFVDHTVAPTYTALADATERLADQLAELRANPNEGLMREACATFLEARAWWEKSEAFLFGAAGDFGIDPHIDSWPLAETEFNNLMNSPLVLQSLDGDEGDVNAGLNLGNNLLGFHGIEYILFQNGQPKSVASLEEKHLIYIAAVAGDLRNRCYQLEVGWLGEQAPQSHIDKLDEVELAYTVAGSDLSYGENMKRAGRAGSIYSSRMAAVIAMAQGCSDIADEVGSSKIYAAWHGEDITYIESPYSYMSITDFTNNIISIQNVWLGGIEGERSTGRSLRQFVADIDADLAAKVDAAIELALTKIAEMPAPFSLHYSDAKNGEAVEACAELSEVFGEVIDALRIN